MESGHPDTDLALDRPDLLDEGDADYYEILEGEVGEPREGGAERDGDESFTCSLCHQSFAGHRFRHMLTCYPKHTKEVFQAKTS
jgi:hypothetical protein